MLNMIKKLLGNDKVRYVIAGGCTTLVNLIVFFCLRAIGTIDRNLCNVIAIIMAMIFAYFSNKLYVFRSHVENKAEVVREAVCFFSGRLVTMLVETLGFAVLCDTLRFSELKSKLFVQVVVVVFNYVFSKVFVFVEKESIREKIKRNYCYYIPFAITLAGMLIVFIAEKITPFGPNAITLVDSLHQYLPFFAEYRDKLLHEGSLFYTWNIALGSNFMSLSAYYLNSPFNFLLLLFDKEHLVTGVCLIAVLKICLSSSTMAYYLANKTGKANKNTHIIAIAVCYAFSNYVVGYFWNFMWLDCLLILPIIMLGFERLVRDRDIKLYVLSLFYCLYCNYYIGYIICLFLVLWFFVYRHGGIRKFFADGIRFAVASLLGGGLAAFSLLPAYFGIMSTAAGKMELPAWEWYGSVFEQLKQQLFLTMPIKNQTFDGGVNLYSGMLCIFTLVLFLLAEHIKLSEKLKRVLLLAILVVSFNSTTLNYIWHGMHDQYGIPNRFSFLFIFVMLLTAYEVLEKMERIHPAYIISAGMLSVTYVLYLDNETAGISKLVLLSSIGLLILYALLCGLFSAGRMKKRVWSVVISGICVAELLVSAITGFINNGYVDVGEYYGTSPQVEEAYEQVKTIAENDDVGFYRAELMKSKVLDEVTWHNMPGVGTFCSTVLGSMVTIMGHLGFYTGANEYLYMGSTPFTNSLLNVRYLLEREEDLNNFGYNYVDSVAGIGIYENPYPLSLGFSVSENVKDWTHDRRPFENQNTLAYDMTGCGNIFNSVSPYFYTFSENCEVLSSGSRITYRPYEAGEVDFTASFYAETDGDYYVNCRGNGVYKIRFYVNGEELAYDRYQIQIFHLGELKAGDYVDIKYTARDKEPQEYTASIYVATYDSDAYSEVYNRLSANMLEVKEYKDGYVRGSIEHPADSVIFTSIPYDEGWEIRLDGKSVSGFAVGDGFLAIDAPAGHHEIELVYTPKGFWYGALISGFSLLVFMLIIMLKTHKNTGADLVKDNKNEIDRKSNI